MFVYAYYEPVPGLWSDESQKALIELWKRSWRKYGWNPVVLTEADAKKHPRYPDFKKRFWSFPTPYGSDYGGGCFMRWVAMVSVDGGMMSDYDVINYGMPPREVNPKLMKIYCSQPGPVWCGAILGPAKFFEAMTMHFYRWPPEKGDWSPEYQLFHCEDQVFIRQMLDSNRYPCPKFLRRVEGCTMYPNTSGPLVHYNSAAMKSGGHWPKHEFIEKLRPI